MKELEEAGSSLKDSVACSLINLYCGCPNEGCEARGGEGKVYFVYPTVYPNIIAAIMVKYLIWMLP